MRLRWLLPVLLLAATARAETDRQKAEKEIDAEMKELVKPLPAPTVRVVWDGVDSDKVAIDEARFELDDARLSYGEVDELQDASKGAKTLYDGSIDPGKHALNVNLVVHRTKVSLLEGLRRTTYKISSSAAFPGQPGLSVTLRIKLHYDENEQDPKKRLRLDTRVEPKMVAHVDDAPMPDMPHTVIATAKEQPAAASATKSTQREPDAELEPGKHARGKHSKPAKQTKQTRFASASEREKPAPIEGLAKTEPPPPVVAEDAGAAVAAIIPDAGPPDAGPVDAGPSDAGPVDAGAAMAAAVDAGSPPSEPGASTSNYFWGIVVAIAVFVIVLVIGLRGRKR